MYFELKVWTDTGNWGIQEPIKKNGSLRSRKLTSSLFFQLPLLIYNSRTIFIIILPFPRIPTVFMYIQCFNVSICFKMGSLYSYCDIITNLVSQQNCLELQNFVLNLLKCFWGRTPHPSFNHSCFWMYYNHHTANHLKRVENTNQISSSSTK